MNPLAHFALFLFLISGLVCGPIVFSDAVFNETFEDVFVGIVATQPDDLAIYNSMLEDVKRYVNGDPSVDISNYNGFKFYIYKVKTKCSVSKLLRKNCIKDFWLYRVNARDLVDLFNLQTASCFIDVFIEFDSSKALLYSLYLHYLKYILTFETEELAWHQGVEVEYTQLFKGVPKNRNRWYNLILPPNAMPNSQPVDLFILIQSPNLAAYLSKRITFYKARDNTNQPREPADYPDIVLKYLMEIEFEYIDPNGDLTDFGNIRFGRIIPVGLEIDISGGIVCKTIELVGNIPTQTITTTTTTTTQTDHSDHSNHSHSSGNSNYSNHSHSSSHSHSGKGSHKSSRGKSDKSEKSEHGSSGSGSESGKNKHNSNKKKKKKKKKTRKDKKKRKARFIDGLFERLAMRRERRKQREIELMEDDEYYDIELIEVDILAFNGSPDEDYVKYPVIFRNTSNSGKDGKSSSKSSKSSHSN